MKKIPSFLFVALQIACILFLLFRNHWPNSLLGAACWMLSLLLISWVMITPGAKWLQIMPEPSPHAVLITTGPFHFIRHPLYTAVLLFAFGMLLDKLLDWNLPVFLLLCSVLLLKIHREETFLLELFPAYKSYSLHTKRLIPFLY